MSTALKTIDELNVGDIIEFSKEDNRFEPFTGKLGRITYLEKSKQCLGELVKPAGITFEDTNFNVYLPDIWYKITKAP